MDCLWFVYKWISRDLRKIIISIFKAWLAVNIKKINYVQSYSFNSGKIEKNWEKILLIYTQDKEKLLDFLSKNFSQIEKIDIN